MLDAMLDAKLLTRVVLRMVTGVAMLIALLFLPAGTWRFWPGWMFMAAFFVPALFASAILIVRDPALLERRLQTQEVHPDQRRIIGVTNVVFIGGLLIPGFDHRFGWSQLPWAVIIAANVVVFAGYMLVYWVLRTNSYAARTIRVETEQQVIDTGPYARVRHPMYTGLLVMMAASSPALGSLWALPLFVLVLPPLLALRIRGEERVLQAELPGYADYCQRVRWRLLPGIW